MIGWAQFDDTNVNKVPPPYLPLIFWIRPTDGAPYKVDLTDLSDLAHRTSNTHNRKGADLEGRDGFTRAFALSLCNDRTAHWSYLNKRSALRLFLRFLQDVDPQREIFCSDLVSDHLGLQLQSWLEQRGSKDYRYVRNVVMQIREASPPLLDHLMPLLWPPRDADEPPRQKDIKFESVRALNMAFVKEAMDIKAMFENGEMLASMGRDPRAFPDRAFEQAWGRPENHAWLAKAILAEAAVRDLEQPATFHGPVFGPTHWAPGLKPLNGHRLGRKLRWFTFGRRDAMVFLWLFLLKTGWNLSTALELDVREERRWCHVDRLSPRHRVLRAYKGRAGKLQYATSLAQPTWFPYRIVTYMIERTEPLRAIVRRRLAAARLTLATDKTEAQRSIAELEALVKSPWLYVAADGQIDRLRHKDHKIMNEMARLVEEKDKRARAERERTNPKIQDRGDVRGDSDAPSRVPVGPIIPDAIEVEKWVTSDARDARIRHAYEASGFDAIVAQAAGQHSRVRTGKHYLGAASLDEVGERRFRTLQTAIFSDIGAGQPLDPTRLRILVERDKITPEQEARLLDLRMRTKVGMGCLDHVNPPKAVAPGHVAGQVCAVQRCACCVHGVVFEESLPSLARRAVELRLIEESVPFEAWSGSSLEAEVEAIDATLGSFDQNEVEAALSAWRMRFERGDVVVQDTFPA